MTETYFLLEIFIIHRQNSRIILQANNEKNSEFYTRQFWEKQKSQFHRIIDKQNISSFKGQIFFLVFQCCFISSHNHPLIRSLKEWDRHVLFRHIALTLGLCHGLALIGDTGLSYNRAWTVNFCTILSFIAPSQMAGMRSK